MNLTKHFMTKHRCYTKPVRFKPKGIMVHSTGANNPFISRYLQPDDGIIGFNKYKNDWNNQNTFLSVHGFIGKTTKGDVRTYQALPWDYQAWHCGGSGNQTHISFEICEDGLSDRGYFNKVYQEAVELCAYLCKLYGLTHNDIIDHSEGRKKGIASNHGDVGHWFPKHGKSMATFRKDVQVQLLGKPVSTPAPTTPSQTEQQRISKLADVTLAGTYGNGDARKKALGKDYDAVQKEINRRLVSTPAPKPSAQTEQQRISKLADATVAGKYGNGEARKKNLGKDYDAVQKEINRRYG